MRGVLELHSIEGNHLMAADVRIVHTVSVSSGEGLTRSDTGLMGPESVIARPVSAGGSKAQHPAAGAGFAC